MEERSPEMKPVSLFPGDWEGDVGTVRASPGNLGVEGQGTDCASSPEQVRVLATAQGVAWARAHGGSGELRAGLQGCLYGGFLMS